MNVTAGTVASCDQWRHPRGVPARERGGGDAEAVDGGMDVLRVGANVVVLEKVAIALPADQAPTQLAVDDTRVAKRLEPRLRGDLTGDRRAARESGELGPVVCQSGQISLHAAEGALDGLRFVIATRILALESRTELVELEIGAERLVSSAAT